MDVKLPGGKYIVAVSGGVDSVVLLDLLAQQKDLELVVAHFDHGIRADSADDAKFVEGLAKKYGFVFELGHGHLGKDVSEAEARDKRYAFLKNVQSKNRAVAIITAHHQDDLIETSIINILRGTSRRGLTSLKTSNDIIRPLLEYPKAQLLAYAKQHELSWHEDSTNADTKYLRNKIRLEIVPKMDEEQRRQWLDILQGMEPINNKIDLEIQQILRYGLHKGQLVLNRKWFTMLPHNIAKEVIVNILVKTGATEIDKKTVERLSVQIKTLRHGKVLQAPGVDVILTKRSARFKRR
jgi:tRNA(Ile)-lysidine synthase